MISPWSLEAIGTELSGFGVALSASTAPTSNMVTYVPVVLAQAFTAVTVGWFNGAAAGNGNAQVGIYHEDGTQIVECTATTTSGTTARQTVDITDTVLPPGRYYMAFRASSGTDRIHAVSPAAGILEACGVMQQATQTDLPSSASFAANATAFLPMFYLSGHSLL